MKDLKDIVVLVHDYGTFVSVADAFGRVCKRALYYSPYEEEYRDVKKCCIGGGLEYVERCDRPLDPKILAEVDLHIFPDIGFGDRQALLKSMGKKVWGSGDATNLELSRTQFLEVIKSLGMPYIKSVPLTGLTALAKHLATVKNKWVKVNRFRANMETWHHFDIEHSIRKLEALAVDFGGVKEEPEFLVQDNIESDVEIGYDGWCVFGEYPESSFQGYEKKNELYLGSLLKYEELPEQVRMVNEKMAPILKGLGYCNHIATELRIKDDIGYFIDPTNRLPGQTGEHLFTTCENMCDVMWHGANSIMLPPKFRSKFALEATMHYTGDCDAWKILRVPDGVEQYVKLYHYCMVDDMCHFPIRKGAGSDEVGVICGDGDTIEQAFKNLMTNFSTLKDEPVSINSEEFARLIQEVEKAQKEGIKFTNQKLPSPSIALKD